MISALPSMIETFAPAALYAALSVTSFTMAYLAWKAQHRVFTPPYAAMGLIECGLMLCHLHG